MADPADQDGWTEAALDLLSTFITNACVNTGDPESGNEIVSVRTIQEYLGDPGTVIEPLPGRASGVYRLRGKDPSAPRLLLIPHLDVVPANPADWTHPPFSATYADGFIWGRGAVDMLNLTASMAVAFKEVARSGRHPEGDLIYFAVADEESGSAHGMRWMADHAADAIRADHVLTENGGLHSGSPEAPSISVTVAEKGVAWRRLRIKGVPGHGSMPFRRDNALVTAAGVIQRLTDYRPPARMTELWRERVASMELDAETTAILLDPDKLDAALDTMPAANAAFMHACTHTTFSCNVVDGGLMKTNVIPDDVVLEVDIRTLPGESAAEVQAHLDTALGDLSGRVEIEAIMNDQASISQVNTPLWDQLAKAAKRPFPTARLTPSMSVGFTDARIYREMGAVAYGAGLLSPFVTAAEFGSRFHGNDERIDVESLELCTQFWLDVIA